MLYLGEIAAIITSITFAVNSTLFTIAGRKVGSIVVNRLRLVAASLLLMLFHWLLLGSPWPVGADPERWIWLGLSGIVGLALGDTFLFQAFVLVGPRISMLMMSLAPLLAAAAARIFYKEHLSPRQLLGIGLTIIGIIWVISDKNRNQASGKPDYFKGVMFGLLGAIGQALGLVLAKNGLADSFSPVSANFIRMVSATLVIWFAALLSGDIKSTVTKGYKHSSALKYIIGGAIAGPVVGVSLSLFALQFAQIGIVSTLTSLPPIFLLPIDHYFFKEPIGWGAIAGTCLAVLGVGILFMG